MAVAADGGGDGGGDGGDDDDGDNSFEELPSESRLTHGCGEHAVRDWHSGWKRCEASSLRAAPHSESIKAHRPESQKSQCCHKNIQYFLSEV